MDCLLGITQWSLPGNGFESLPILSQCGFDGLQLDIGSYDDGYYLSEPKIQNALLEDGKRYGIEYPSLCINDLGKYSFLNRNDTSASDIVKDSFELALNVAKKMEIHDVVIPMFFESFINDERDFEKTVEVLKAFVVAAKNRGINVHHEAVLSAEKEVELVKRIDEPNFYILYDSGNISYFNGTDQLTYLDTIFPYIGNQLHVKESLGTDDKGGSLGTNLLGEGDSRFFDSIDYLKNNNYSGWIIIENFYYKRPIRDITDDRYELAKKDLEIIRNSLKKTI